MCGLVRSYLMRFARGFGEGAAFPFRRIMGASLCAEGCCLINCVLHGFSGEERHFLAGFRIMGASLPANLA